MNPFPPTHWTLILSAKEGESKASRDAMNSLAQSYWQPIYAWLRGRGRSHEEAQDDTQGFFAYLLDRRFLGNVQPEGGRFRNFLLVCLRRWMKDECNRVTNLKRRAEVGMQPWHEKEEPALFPRRDQKPRPERLPWKITPVPPSHATAASRPRRGA